MGIPFHLPSLLVQDVLLVKSHPLQPMTFVIQYSEYAGIYEVIVHRPMQVKERKAFRRSSLAEYSLARNFPGIPRTSRLSPHLKWGEIHPHTSRNYYSPRYALMRYDKPREQFEATWGEIFCGISN